METRLNCCSEHENHRRTTRPECGAAAENSLFPAADSAPSAVEATVPVVAADSASRAAVKIAVLVSGNGSNLGALLEAEARGELGAGTVSLVISSRSDAYALTRARERGVETAVLRAADAESGILALLRERGIRLLVLAGYLKILSPAFIEACPAPIINIHPSLLPAFGGRGYYGLRVHEAVLASGSKLSGATVHRVSAIPDGGEILMQKAVSVLPDDHPERLQARVLAEAEWQILPRAVREICEEVSGGEKMQKRLLSVASYLRERRYPGRGILVGLSEDGEKSLLIYFIMGRSSNSRNRVFRAEAGGLPRGHDDLRIYPYDPALLEDASLILYRPLAALPSCSVVSNGDQTDTIVNFLESGRSFSEALQTRRYEPDAPNFTPRVSAILEYGGRFPAYTLSILRKRRTDELQGGGPRGVAGEQSGNAAHDEQDQSDGRGERAEQDDNLRLFYPYVSSPGLGHLIHTYEDDGNPLPSFRGEPVQLHLHGSEEQLAREIWQSLDEENRVALFLRSIDWRTGEAKTLIMNRHGQEG